VAAHGPELIQIFVVEWLPFCDGETKRLLNKGLPPFWSGYKIRHDDRIMIGSKNNINLKIDLQKWQLFEPVPPIRSQFVPFIVNHRP